MYFYLISDILLYLLHLYINYSYNSYIVDITMFKIVTFKLLNSYIPSKMVTLVCVSKVFYWFWGTKFGI